ncbi:DUF5009 domain-containing protein [Rapidithrix thailandica]|uniref:DUF5009 domain-containing protein n=1 Tax=Rapidithrix thailandica TaxID=413964 RepID=A0AAW9S086_9BACT
MKRIMTTQVTQKPETKPLSPPIGMYKSMTGGRIESIDSMRGLTILTMIFVNEVAGVSGIPQWMKHVSADADAMTFVDVVFPAFLFIVGMSIPFSTNARFKKGDSPLQVWKHILVRTVSLWAIGVFMVNVGTGYNEEAMGMSIHLWTLLMYACIFLVWNIYPKSFTFQKKWTIRGVGLAGMLTLFLLYRGGDGTEPIQPQWWGILGLIGWAYLYANIGYWLVKGNRFGLLALLFGCIAFYALANSSWVEGSWFTWMKGQAGNASHMALTLGGVVLSLIFFEKNKHSSPTSLWVFAAVFAILVFALGYVLRPYFGISKIHATPTWALYCIGICIVLYAFLYWLLDLQKQKAWSVFLKPAGANPLLIYFLPPILLAGTQYVDFHPLPQLFHSGLPGILWSWVFAFVMLGAVVGLNKLKIRLHL